MLGSVRQAAKAIVAVVVPLLLPLIHRMGLVDVTSEFLNTAIMMIVGGILVFVIPNKDP